MDPEHLDEMERRGDSLLDEERYESGRRLKLPATGQEFNIVRHDEHGWMGVTLSAEPAGFTTAQFSMDYDIARQFANAILSEIEIADRAEAGEFEYMICSECGTVGNVDDAIEVGGECPWADCDGTIEIYEEEKR